MKKLIYILFIFLSVSVDAQPFINGWRYTVTTTPPPLDTYTGSVVAYSFRLLRTAYSGNCIKVRRSSDDTEQDIGFVSGFLDTASLKTFVSSNSGYISKWYDQSGNSHDGVQTTNANQPRIVNAGAVEYNEGQVAAYMSGNYFLSLSYSMSQPSTYFMVTQNSGLDNHHFIDGNTDRQLLGMSGSHIVLYAGALLVGATTVTNTQLLYALFNSSSSAISYNGNTAVTGNAGTMGISSWLIGSGQGAGNAIIGYMNELIVYDSDQSSNRTGIESNINSYYTIY